ncbi:zinc-ribbon domain-containing protein [Agromyces sp. Marseille-P2726]|uniref:zinc-ribbon domain-containing protein n=1 Tax=Agromyces sp. Marseille-P2726 TaxID=2709132 RepID=UPI00156D50F6|nr:zinc-ribbon domain-containing protein [Agromyces sp. Marseille-P2726]
MFFFIGVFPREREVASARFRCDHCHEDVAQHFVESGSRLWLFFIPLFTFGRRYVMICSNCGWTTEVSPDMAKRVTDLAAHNR